MKTCINLFLMVLGGAICGSIIEFIMLPSLGYLIYGVYYLDGMYVVCYLFVGAMIGSLITILLGLSRLAFRQFKIHSSRSIRLLRGMLCGALGSSFMVLQLASPWDAMAELVIGITCGIILEFIFPEWMPLEGLVVLHWFSLLFDPGQ